ncbi:MAG: hypothetical protein O7G13_14075 [Alphaproteobacteria bacterium]|nr:hypothetical protein [Alphaproteobacteria bacterium]
MRAESISPSSTLIAENIGTALMLDLPGRVAAEDFWNNEPFVANGGYQDDSRIYRWVFGD